MSSALRDSSVHPRADLRRLWVVVLLTATTGAIAQLALVLRLTYVTGSGLVVAGLWIAATVPVVVLAPVTGSLLDRVETVLVLRSTALAQAGLDIGLALVPGVGPVLLLTLGLAVAAATSLPGLYALAGTVSARDDGQGSSALTMVQAAGWAGGTLGPVVGAGLVVSLGTRIPLGIDAAGLLVTCYCLGRLSIRRRPGLGESRESPAVLRGLRLLVGDSLLRHLLGPVALVIVGVNLAVVVDVFLATRVLGAGSVGYGTMVAIWGGGMVLGTLLAPRIKGGSHLSMTGVGGLLAALGLAGAGVSPDLAAVLAAYLLGGIGNGLEASSARLLLQERARPEIQGRAFAAYFAFGSAAAVAGTLVGGALLAPIGARWSLELAAALAAAGGLILLALGRSGPRGRVDGGPAGTDPPPHSYQA